MSDSLARLNTHALNRLDRQFPGWPHAIVLLLVLRAALSWSGTLDPNSLWFDDVWVAAIARLPKLLDAVRVTAPVPPGFVALEWVALRAFRDPEWSLQVVPFVAALSSIPLVATLSYRLTASRWVALASSAAWTVNPWLGGAAVAAKQYATDALVTLLLCALADRAVQHPSIRTLAVSAMVGLAAVFFSLSAVFLGTAIVGAIVVLIWLREPISRMHAAGVGAVYGVGLWLVGKVIVAGRSAPALQDYWSHHFLPVTSPSQTLRFLLAVQGPTALAAPLPFGVAPLALLVLPGLAWLWVTRSRFAAVVTLFLLGLPVASALRLYPMGGYRTDTFLHPLSVLLAATGLHALAAWLRGARANFYLRVAPALVTITLAFVATPQPRYPPHASKEMREGALASIEREALVLHSAQWWVGYYGRWPYRLESDPESGTSFRVAFEEGPRILALHEGAAGTLAWLRELAAQRAVTVVASTVSDADTDHIAVLELAGLSLVLRAKDDGLALFDLMVREDPR